MAPTYRILVGDVREQLTRLRAGCVQTCVTSPPYFGLRDYGVAGQIGREGTVAEYVETMVRVFREVRRVLRDDGTLWLNLGDSYTMTGGTGMQGKNGQRADRRFTAERQAPRGGADGLKPKDLIGVPWRVAFALQADGWYLRQDIIWHKPNPMPESVTDRCTKAHEYLFLLSKSERYYWDREAMQEPSIYAGDVKKLGAKSLSRGQAAGMGEDPHGGGLNSTYQVKPTRNRRSVWTIAARPYKGAHFATFPETLVEPCILAGSAPRACPTCGAGYLRQVERAAPPKVAPSDVDRFGTGSAGVHRKIGTEYQAWLNANPRRTVGWAPGCACANADSASVAPIVLDPFAGSGTTLACALRHGRRAVGVELNPEYASLAHARIAAVGT